MKIRGCGLLLCAVMCGAQTAAGAAEARPGGAAKEPAENGVRIERVEPEDKAERDKAARDEAAERARVDAVAARPLPVPTPLKRVAGDAIFKEAYADVYGILSGDNECSRFFGGAATAARVFNGLAARLTPGKLQSARTGSTMSGDAFDVIHQPTGHKSRLFEKAVINSEGPFYRRRMTSGDAFVPNIGSFGAATSAARALILLHELGHLLRGPDGKWLLRDDGDNESLSMRNTALVEENCGEQLKALDARPERREADDAATRLAAEAAQSPDEF